tara:strand:+ start:1173 stop:1553 length:381 start_codon:yes stop_codon:yes gene_type:complete
MNIESCKFTNDHEWVYIENGDAIVGISEHASKELGEIVFVELPPLNQMLNQKDEFGSVESVKTVSSVYSPVTGEVIEVNEELENRPELVNNSPFEEGWIIKLKVSDTKELDDLMTYEEYQNYIETL